MNEALAAGVSGQRMRLLAVDPDPDGGSWALFGPGLEIVSHGRRTPVCELLELLESLDLADVAVEDLQSYGMAAGASMFQTAKVIGELRCTCRRLAICYDEISRPKIKTALCGTPRGKDANVRQALIDLYGGDKRTAVGLKACPGPLYGVSKDIWAALALGVVWLARRDMGPLAARDGVI